jgi:hypothetical protein
MLLCTISFRRCVAALLGAGFLAAAVGLVTVPGGAVAQDTAYLADVDDLPLAPGLTEDPAARVVFDKPEGRIVEAAASGPVAAAAVSAFYADTLPALGWVPAGPGAWTRARERLEIRVDAAATPLIARFSIAPRAQ